MSSWNKGLTKETSLSVRKISNTMRRKRIDNFYSWREERKVLGKIPDVHTALEKNGDLAELMGVVLGDGHIEKFPRTERLAIASNSNNIGFITRYACFVEDIFRKKPYVGKNQKLVNCVRISIYQKCISKRLGIPTGSRKNLDFKVPRWIWQDKEFLVRFLRGLYEAEGSFCKHKATSTYKFLFANRNPVLLGIVFEGVQRLGFHPHRSKYQIQLSRRKEVYECKDLLNFRRY